MMAQYGEVTEAKIVEFKALVTAELTPFTSVILLDPEYGLEDAKNKAEKAGLLLAYEKIGYDTTKVGRLPDLLANWSVKRLKEQGADACKFLLYYDVAESQVINEQKQAFVERIESECVAEGAPFFLEFLAYDAKGLDVSSAEFAKAKPHKVIAMMKEFSQARYNVNVLKVEVSVNMDYVAEVGEKPSVYSKKEAMYYFKEQSEVSQVTFIFLSAGVSAARFQETLRFAKQAGSKFSGVLCGRATWADAVKVYMQAGKAETIRWLRNQGRKNIEELSRMVKDSATAWE